MSDESEMTAEDAARQRESADAATTAAESIETLAPADNGGISAGTQEQRENADAAATAAGSTTTLAPADSVSTSAETQSQRGSADAAATAAESTATLAPADNGGNSVGTQAQRENADTAATVARSTHPLAPVDNSSASTGAQAQRENADAAATAAGSTTTLAPADNGCASTGTQSHRENADAAATATGSIETLAPADNGCNSAGTQAQRGNADTAATAAGSTTTPAPADNSGSSAVLPPQRTIVILMDDVRKTYVMGEETVHALRGVSFAVRQGEFVSIMGPSGSGKSTCMNMIGCLDRPTSGVVEIGGKPTAAMSEKELAVLRNKTVGFVFQQYHLLPAMTVLENVMIPLRYQGIERGLRKDMAEAALERVGLANRMRHLPAELSGGQKQRVAIARATVTHPQIILADEPTGALDSATGRAVLELFGEINAAGTTIVIVTHDPKIGASTKRCIRILDGRIQRDDEQTPQPFAGGADA